MNKTQQGDIGVATAILHFTKEGWICSVPTTEQSRYDLIVDHDGELERIQVKTSNYQPDGDVYQVQLRTNGANYTTKNNVAKISSDEVDFVFILIGDGRCYNIPSELLSGKSTVSPENKYKDFLVATYAPLV